MEDAILFTPLRFVWRWQKGMLKIMTSHAISSRLAGQIYTSGLKG